MVPSPARNASQSTLAVHTLEEAAAILQVRKSWLERRAAARKIPFTMLGGAYHFTSAHLAEIIRIHENLPAAQAEPHPRQEATKAPQVRRHAEPQTVTPLRARPRAGSRRVA
jgi:excisionase family DNA binding protein